MTPTLWGRWQTRLFTLWTLGAIVAAGFTAGYGGDTFFLVLAYVTAFGLAWDVLYIYLQRRRWDRDWPTAFQVANGATEGLLVYLLIDHAGLPGITLGAVPLWLFVAHYGSTWAVIFGWLQGPMRVLLPRWRFDGARVVGFGGRHRPAARARPSRAWVDDLLERHRAAPQLPTHSPAAESATARISSANGPHDYRRRGSHAAAITGK